MSKGNMKKRLDRLAKENRRLWCKNGELLYQLNNLQEIVDIANEEEACEMLRVRGSFIIDCVHTSGDYRDIITILLENGYEVGIMPLTDGTRLKITIKESEVG